MYFHVSKDLPALDAEGHAVLILNNIRLHDIKGEMGRTALLYLGTIHFFRHEYKDADFYFSRLYEEYPNDKEAAKAIKQSVICKQLLTGGSVYDLRGVDESKKLLMTAMGAYPELAKDDDWVRSQLTSMNTQQADRDFKIAAFYERTGHPGSAYFYYELVCRRYPNSEYATKAAERKVALKSKADKEQRNDGGPAPAPPPTVLGPQLDGPRIPIPPRALPPNMPGP
jgi:outer membrane protein assembly factor BamD (BamD/ComL family)